MGTPKTRRKLLVASVGVAALVYGCKRNSPAEPEPVGNLVAPDPPPTAEPADAQPLIQEPTVGNLVPPEPPQDGGPDANSDR